MKCLQCGRDFVEEGTDCPIASISGSIMGDEYIDSYFFCSRCQVYTVEAYHDRFLGDEEIFAKGPLSKSEGDAKVALIQECAEPWDKKCRCSAHQTYFDGALD
jgi:hypothetical protein